MFKRFVFLFFVIIYSSIAIAQTGIIRGKIVDASNGEVLIGATVVVVGTTTGAVADLDGNFSLENLDEGDIEIKASFIGYESIIKSVSITKDEVEIINFNLIQAGFVIEQAAEVVVKANREADVYMENIKKKNVSSIDYISSQQIKQTGDSDAAAAMKRISGVSTVGNFVFVRGLSDRYIKTTLNGAEVPSINPRRNTIEMDIFPTNMIDNLVVVKTQSANLPGDWSGAYLNVITKDFPEKFTLNYSSGIGFNSQTTNREIISSTTSRTDWLGYDDGFRDAPNILDTLNIDNFPQVSMPCYFEGLVYLGYADELASMGIEDCLDIEQGQILNIVETLGISLDELEEEGMTPLSSDMNSHLSEIGKSFTNTWGNTTRRAPVDQSHNLSFGNQTKLFGRPLGYLFGFQYKRSTRFIEDGIYGRYNAGSYEFTDVLQPLKEFGFIRSTEQVYWNTLLNLSYKLNEFNKLSFMAMPNVSGQNSSRLQNGIDITSSDDLQTQRTQRYEERVLNIFQIRGEHYLPGIKAEINWVSSYSDGVMRTPDLKVMYNNSRLVPNDSTIYFGDATGVDLTEEALDIIETLIDDGEWGVNWTELPDSLIISTLQNNNVNVSNYDVQMDTSYSINQSFYPLPTRYFRQLEEDKFDTKINFILPLIKNEVDFLNFSTGVSFVKTTRRHQESIYNMYPSPSGEWFNGIDTFFDAENFDIVRGSNYIATQELTDLVNSDSAYMNVFGGYVMLDGAFKNKTKFNIGLRVENTDMFIRSNKLSYLEESGGVEPVDYINLQGGLQDIDLMPSLNIVRQIGETDGIKLTNFRFAYSKSIARPVFREKSPFRGFDFETLEVLKGNPNLDGTKIDNFDLRLEHYLGIGEVISASLFYKRFTDPIEQTSVLESSNTEYTWANIPYANVYGLELEVRKNLQFIGMPRVTFLSNVSIIKSEARILEEELNFIRETDPMHAETRPFYGQAPYLVNGMLSYRNDSLNVNASIAYNVQGEKLILNTVGGLPDIYQQPTPTLDLTISKGITENMSLKFRGGNLINPINRKTYLYNNELYDWLSFRTGRNYSLSLTYSIR